MKACCDPEATVAVDAASGKSDPLQLHALSFVQNCSYCYKCCYSDPDRSVGRGMHHSTNCVQLDTNGGETIRFPCNFYNS